MIWNHGIVLVLQMNEGGTNDFSFFQKVISALGSEHFYNKCFKNKKDLQSCHSIRILMVMVLGFFWVFFLWCVYKQRSKK